MVEKRTLSDAEIKSSLEFVRNPEPAIEALAKLLAQAESEGQKAIRIPTDHVRNILVALKRVASGTSPNDGTDFQAADVDPSDLPPTSSDW